MTDRRKSKFSGALNHSLPMKPSWSCSTNYGRASGLEIRASSHEKRGPDASGGLPGTDPETSTSPGRRMGGVDRNRGVTAWRDGQPSFDSANSFSFIGSARGTSAMLHPGVVDGLTASLAGRESGDSRRDGTQFSSRGDESHRAPARGTYLGRSAECSVPRDPAVARFNQGRVA